MSTSNSQQDDDDQVLNKTISIFEELERMGKEDNQDLSYMEKDINWTGLNRQNVDVIPNIFGSFTEQRGVVDDLLNDIQPEINNVFVEELIKSFTAVFTVKSFQEFIIGLLAENDISAVMSSVNDKILDIQAGMPESVCTMEKIQNLFQYVSAIFTLFPRPIYFALALVSFTLDHFIEKYNINDFNDFLADVSKFDKKSEFLEVGVSEEVMFDCQDILKLCAFLAFCNLNFFMSGGDFKMPTDIDQAFKDTRNDPSSLFGQPGIKENMDKFLDSVYSFNFIGMPVDENRPKINIELQEKLYSFFRKNDIFRPSVRGCVIC